MVNEKMLALNSIKETLEAIGYSKTSIVSDYSISTEGNNVYKLDMVAFKDDLIHDFTTSCISVKWCNRRSDKQSILEKIKLIATPYVLLPERDKVEVWNIKVGKSEKVYQLKYNELYPYFQENRIAFSSKIISKSKYDQINFFEAFQLQEFAEKANYRILSDQFERGLLAGKKILDKKLLGSDKNYQVLTSLTMHVIAAMVLSHKLYPNESIPSIYKLVDRLSTEYKHYFNQEMIYYFGREVIGSIYDNLSKGISYRSINNEMLGYFYESTLFGESKIRQQQKRKEFGIYYTPKFLADDILEHIPVEFLEESNRSALDGSCGSGSLLISTYKRLKRLLPAKMSESCKHDYLTRNIHGIEIDRFAAEVSRLSLLLYSIPCGDSWRIHNTNTLKTNELLMEEPSIIIGNPPFGEERKEHQKQKAMEFMNRYMKWLKPNGFLGVILPESFLENNSCIQIRKELLDNFDILELWSLAGGVFRRNNCATIVIIAQKKSVSSESKQPIKIRIINKRSASSYLSNRRADIEFFEFSKTKWLKNENYVIRLSPIQSIVDKLEKYPKLKDVTNGIQGIQVPLTGEFPFVSEKYQEGFVKYLQTARGKCFNNYLVNWEQQEKYKYVRYDEYVQSLDCDFPGLRLRLPYRYIYESEKVLLQLSSTPGQLRCVSAAIDREICIPSHSFYCIASKDDSISLEELVGILNSKVVNAFVRSLTRKRTLTIGNSVKLIPIPQLNNEQKLEIRGLVKQLEGIKREQSFSCKVGNLENRINYIINQGFGLSLSEIELLEEYANKYEGKQKADLATSTKVWRLTGEIIDIDLCSMTMRAEFVELDDEYRNILITPELPGWLLRIGIQFKADVDEDSLNNGELRIYNPKPLKYTYMNQEDIANHIRALVSRQGGECS